jgi:low affinity Fe/Cu permease
MLQRQFVGVRVSFVIAAVACYFGAMLVCAKFPGLSQEVVFSAFEKLIVAIGVAVVGDTVRPSGSSTTAFKGSSQ